MNKLCENYAAWCAGDDSAGYEMIMKDELTSNSFSIITQRSQLSNWLIQMIFFFSNRKLTGQTGLSQNSTKSRVSGFFGCYLILLKYV